MSYLAEITGFASWVVAIIVSYYLTVFIVKKFDKKIETTQGNE